ncbi:MAG: YggS family pyridoxal phosphate-dependent enzyme [Clostridia bacterium]|nr:YggS family pyridoxal phosphate-dependent enzyme [Clostridia bacterium]
MFNDSLKENLERVFNEISSGNNLGEEITLVGATKMNDAETVNRAISYGLKVVAENKVQEFREKNDLLMPCRKHFIGHLQTNKAKYLVGKVELIQSVDSLHLAEEINRLAENRGIVQDILAEVNAGNEESKSGFSLDDAFDNVLRLAELNGIRVKGIMAMMPQTADEKTLATLFTETRALYDRLKTRLPDFTYLSMGMSGDYKIAIKNGSNMIRLGTALFGKRNYGGNV